MNQIIETLRNAPYNYNILDTELENVKTLSVAGNTLYIDTEKKPSEWQIEIGEELLKIPSPNDKNPDPELEAKIPIHSKNAARDFMTDYGEVVLNNPKLDNGFKPGGYQKMKDAEWKPPAATKQLVKTKSVPAIAQTYNYSDSQLMAIKNTVAKGATDAEFEMLMYLADRYQLDPILKEIFYSSNLQTIMTSRDGYLKVAHRDPKFRGIQSMAVCENDDFEFDPANCKISHKFGKGERGKIIGAWAIVKKEGLDPIVAYAPYDEHVQQGSKAWKYKSAMCCKCAEVFALKRMFGISGLVTREEVDIENENVIEAEYEVQGEVNASF